MILAILATWTEQKTTAEHQPENHKLKHKNRIGLHYWIFISRAADLHFSRTQNMGTEGRWGGVAGNHFQTAEGTSSIPSLQYSVKVVWNDWPSQHYTYAGYSTTSGKGRHR